MSVERDLSGYVRMVAAELDIPVEATGFEISDTVTAYVGLAERRPERPGQDLMLVWSERHGWFVAVETDPGESPVVLGYLGGEDVTPDPRSVARFVADVLADRRPAAPRPEFPAGRDLAVRLNRYRSGAELA